MNIEKLFSDLSYGELSNLALGVEGTGTILEEHQPKIIRYANDGLMRLHSQFLLSEKDVLIETVPHITNYHLVRRYAMTQWDERDVEVSPYIRDLGREPFEEDVIKILEVYDSYGRELPLNDIEDPCSLFTPQAKVLQVPHPKAGVALSVLYQARHKTLSHEDPEQEINLPDVLYPALTSFIAYKVYSHMNTADSTGKAQEHYGAFQEICSEAVTLDLVSTSISQSNARFQKRGWV